MGEAFELYEDGIIDESGEYIYPGDEQLFKSFHVKKGRPENPTDKNRLNGIVGWLENDTRIRLPKNTADGVGWQRVLFEYGRSVLKIEGQRPIVRAISEDFGKFRKWVLINYRI